MAVGIRGFGSVNNLMMAESKQLDPCKGMGATILSWTDRDAATITRVVSESTIYIRRDESIRTDKNGMSESQTYEYHYNANAEELKVTKRKNGQWRISKAGNVVLIGHRNKYHDYSF